MYRRTKYKQTVAHFQFPKDYPQSAILIELKSKTLSEKLLNKLVEICDQEAKKHISSPQVMQLYLSGSLPNYLYNSLQLVPIITFIKKFLDENFFSICSDEINYIKKNLINPEKDELKIKSKSGTLSFNINQDRFYMTFKIFVPDNYPGEPVRYDY